MAISSLTRVALLATAFAASLATARAADISGAGATFPYPVYAKWAQTYKGATGTGVNYQSIGSGGGIKQIKAKTVTFGATDAPLQAKDLEAAGLEQWPMVMGGIVPVVNIDGIKAGDITIDGPTLAAIFMGTVTKWNDPTIKKLNPSAALPDAAIAVVHRSDGSGTPFNFTDYLSKVSPDWKSKVGENTAVEWPVGIGAKGNEGVANNVANTKGSIGYVDQAGAESWPLTAATFILMHKQPSDMAASAEALKFFGWAFDKGDAEAQSLDYIPMPDKVKTLIKKAINTDIKGADGKPVVTLQ